jgi:hypothetical protein
MEETSVERAASSQTEFQAPSHTLVISQPMLFPWVGMLEQARLCDTYVHYDDVQFSKGSFTNRVQIKTAQGPAWMTVPVLHEGRCQIRDVRVNESTRFREKHLRTLAQSYAQAPHRDRMLALVEQVYAERSTWLADLAIASIEALWDAFGVRPEIVLRSSGLEVGGSSSERVLALNVALGADVYVSGHGGRAYLDHAAFREAGVDVRYMDYEKRPYPQQHGPFTPFVSSLDLLANVGTSGCTQIASTASSWQTPTMH